MLYVTFYSQLAKPKVGISAEDPFLTLRDLFRHFQVDHIMFFSSFFYCTDNPFADTVCIKMLRLDKYKKKI